MPHVAASAARLAAPPAASKHARSPQLPARASGAPGGASALSRRQAGAAVVGSIFLFALDRPQAAQASQTGKLGVDTELAPVDDEYGRATLELGELMRFYLTTTDLYDPKRFEAYKNMKPAIKTWTSKYAPGGSTRRESQRKMYILGDAFLGQFNSNGVAPFPRKKAEQMLNDLQTIETMIAAGQ
ncbi:unnamed protein product [Pedinophyceae sp. YPF-701]|nr:unnamed protein product [Pedinophyceae sp. YPF-701]